MAHLHRRSRGGEGMLMVEQQEQPRQPIAGAGSKLAARTPLDTAPPTSLPGIGGRSEQMPVLGVRAAKVTHPTGDPRLSVLQAFPSGFTAEEADPFLMCDEIGPMVSPGVMTDPDEFPVDWHPHRGMDLLTWMVEGHVRHADSMGNRENFPGPAMQWTSAGSGIEHAEAGGTPEGQVMHGFQIWINVPSARKMDDPRYGTHPTSEIPLHEPAPGVRVRVLAGPFQSGLFKATGPFRTVVDVQVLDIVLQPGTGIEHVLPEQYDNCLIYAYGKKGIMSTISGSLVKPGQVARLDASGAARTITLQAGKEGLSVMLFAGKMLKQAIAWHGPFVMTTQEEIRQTITEYQRGTFLRKRAKWDYKRIAAAPPGTYK